MKISTWVLLGLNVFLWGGLVWTGIVLIEGVKQQHVPGYPASGQIEYYIGIPVIILAASAARTLWLNRKPSSRQGRGMLVATLALLLPYLFFYTGGM